MFRNLSGTGELLPYADWRLSAEERAADAMLADFGVGRTAKLDLLSGQAAPQGRLPVILPKDMETVETHCEDVAEEIEPYSDGEGNRYTLGFGLT